MTTQETGGAAAAASTAKDEAAGLAQSAAESGQGLVHEAKDQGGQVAGEAKDQARDLLDQARSGVREQASEQQTRAAASLRSLGDELGRMASGSEQGGLGTDLVRQAGERTGAVATWLEDREPGDVLHEVTDFARRRPGMFLALALGAGVVAGRLTRGLKDAPPSSGSSAGRSSSGTTSGGGTASEASSGAGSYGTAATGASAAGVGQFGSGDADLGGSGAITEPTPAQPGPGLGGDLDVADDAPGTEAGLGGAHAASGDTTADVDGARAEEDAWAASGEAAGGASSVDPLTGEVREDRL